MEPQCLQAPQWGRIMTTLRRLRVAARSPIVPVDVPIVDELPGARTSVGKRVLDILIATVLLVLTSPVWLVAAVLILTSSRGPILFRQERVGVDGRTFTCLKFRTMRHGASDEAHRSLISRMLSSDAGVDARIDDDGPTAYKLAADARIVPATRWLRKLSLDELPQLINAIRGEMSIVGPRPPLPYEVERYAAWQLERLSVKPGITGLWQVSGRNRLSYKEMCALDVQYVRSWSLWLDLQIMARTPWVMFVDHGAAS
jgi:lipopolysaccharide/colanic/teichoic acid biosynthesis glycosyltransferase